MPIFKCAGTQRFDDAGEPLCDHEDKKRWFGACPGCGRFWNIIKYDVEAARRARRTTLASTEAIEIIPRVATGLKEFDDLTSGGIPEGAVVVISGHAGSGKTTLNLMLAAGAAEHHRRKCALYASAEEANAGLLEKAQRCGLTTPNVELMGSESNIYAITARAEVIKPALLIIDSIQEMYLGNDDFPDRLVEIARFLKKFCAKEKIACLIVSHLSRAGEVRAPTTLDHIVDAMLEFDPRIKENKQGEVDEATRGYRKLTLAMKSRIGTSGSRFFNMTAAGVITPLDEDTYYGRKKKRTVVGDDDPPPKPRNLKLVEKYRKPVES